jgi:hypothetical protein
MNRQVRDRLIELWQGRLSPQATEFQQGYYQGRFEEYAAQRGVSPDDFPSVRAEAGRQQTLFGRDKGRRRR